MSNIDIYKASEDCSYSIAPGWGCNLFSWVVNGVDLMHCPKDLPVTAEKITGGGNPILFPSVGRTWDFSSGTPVSGNYRIYGHDKTFYMPSHGIIFLSEFHKIDEKQLDDGIFAAYELKIPEKVKEENYPFDLGLVQRFAMRPDSVELEAVITNHGDVPAPCAFGYHPYFAVSNNKREGIRVVIPAKKRNLLTPDTVQPTGETEPAEETIDLQAGIYYDSAYAEPTGNRMSLIDQNAGRSIHVDLDEKCEMLVLYSPDESDFVCIEPWTRGLAAFAYLNEPGWEDGKRIPVLKPREVMSFKSTFSCER